MGLFETSSLRYLQDSVDSLAYYLSVLQTVTAWAVRHPYWAVAIAIFSLTLLNTLIGLTSDALKRAVTWSLRAPLRLMQWLLWAGLRSTQRALVRQPASPPNAPPNDSPNDQIVRVLQQLDALRQQQDTLLKDLKTLLVER